MPLPYKQTFSTIHNLLHEIKSNPYTQIDKHYEIQSKILRALKKSEGRITQLRSEIAFHKRDVRKQRKGASAIPESLESKRNLAIKNHELQQYRTVRYLLQSFGDGLAYIHLDHTEVKRISLREGPGFVSGKTGLTAELSLLNAFKNSGTIAILNDLTTTLNYGDITALDPRSRQYGILEVKSSSKHGSRARSQEKALKDFFAERSKDFLEGPLGESIPKKVHITNPIKTYIEYIEELLDEAKQNTPLAINTEEGQSYLAVRSIKDLKNLDLPYAPENTYALLLQPTKPFPYGHPPLCYSLSDFSAWWQLVSLKIHLICLVNISTLKLDLIQRGISTVVVDKEDGFLVAHKELHGKYYISFDKSRLLRLVTEFLSLTSLANEVVESVEFLDSNLHN